jgi:hypothetical protein
MKRNLFTDIVGGVIYWSIKPITLPADLLLNVGKWAAQKHNVDDMTHGSPLDEKTSITNLACRVLCGDDYMED